MKKQFVAVSVATTLLFGGTVTNGADAAATGKVAACQYEGKNGECTHHVMKATSKHFLQDLRYWDAYEPSKKALKVGAYYMVTYEHDTPVLALLIKPTKDEKKRWDKRAAQIKAKQAKTKNYKKYMVYSYGL